MVLKESTHKRNDVRTAHATHGIVHPETDRVQQPRTKKGRVGFTGNASAKHVTGFSKHWGDDIADAKQFEHQSASAMLEQQGVPMTMPDQEADEEAEEFEWGDEGSSYTVVDDAPVGGSSSADASAKKNAQQN